MQSNKDKLKGKKLLLLGGGTDMVSVTKLAQSMGCLVYVLDYYDTLRSPAKLVADEATNISIFDTDAVLSYIREKEIDGALTGYTDSYLKQYCKICELAGLPCYGTERAFGIATDKMLFKHACVECGVGVIPGTNAYDFETVEHFAEKNGYPLMVKPVDNSGSRGVIKCEKPETLRECFEYAMSFSESKNVIVEKYMDCDSIGIVYQLAGGKAHLAAVCDRDVYSAKGSGSSIVVGTNYPSKYVDRYIKEADAPMRRMLEENGFHDGMVSPMAFVDERGFYMCEMCYRPSGGHHFTLIQNENGIDGLKLLIEYAVTGKTESYEPEKEKPHFKEYCGMIHILGIAEKCIGSMDGLDDIAALPFVLEICQELRPGQTIGKDGTTAQTLASVWVSGKNEEEYRRNVETVKSKLTVCDNEGNSLII